VEPGATTEGGYILGSSNFDNTPLNNSMEQFVLALAQGHVGAKERVQRFFDPFFTVITMDDIPEADRGNSPLGDGFAMSDLTAELKSLANPVPAEGSWTEAGIQDVQGFGRTKVAKARLAVDNALYLIGNELLSATRWMDIRRAQSPSRSFGVAPAAAWRAWRVISPWQQDPEEREQMEPWRIMLPYRFIKENSASRFLGEHAAGPDVSVATQVDEADRGADEAGPVDVGQADDIEGAAAEAQARRNVHRSQIRELRRHAQELQREVRQLRRQARQRDQASHRSS
jgi:histidine ammonia-lyase